MLLLDIYNELGLNYIIDGQNKKNLYDVYINIYYPYISLERFNQILQLLNNENINEIQYIENQYISLINDLKIETEIENLVESTKIKLNDVNYKIIDQIIDQRNKCKYLVVNESNKRPFLVPIKPSGIIWDIKITKNYNKYINSLEYSIETLMKLFKISNKKENSITCKVLGLFMINNMIVNIILLLSLLTKLLIFLFNQLKLIIMISLKLLKKMVLKHFLWKLDLYMMKLMLNFKIIIKK